MLTELRNSLFVRVNLWYIELAKGKRTVILSW